MKKGIAGLALGVLFTAGTLAMHGTAGAASATSFLAVHDFDIWDFQCTSGLTHCMRVYVCDDWASSADVWEVTVGGYYPTAVVGQGGTAGAYYGNCSTTVSVCRPGATAHGAMRALVSVNHPWGAGKDAYDLNASCHDVNGLPLPAGGTKLQLKN